MIVNSLNKWLTIWRGKKRRLILPTYIKINISYIKDLNVKMKL